MDDINAVSDAWWQYVDMKIHLTMKMNIDERNIIFRGKYILFCLLRQIISLW